MERSPNRRGDGAAHEARARTTAGEERGEQRDAEDDLQALGDDVRARGADRGMG